VGGRCTGEHCLDHRFVKACRQSLAKLGENTLDPDLVELVEGDQG
jgi:hypothetical protein